MKPFNLERALAGDPIVTRNGIKILEIKYFSSIDVLYPVIAVIDGCSATDIFTLEGKWDINVPTSSHDLFMAPKKKTYWVNVYNDPYVTLGSIFFSKEDADQHIKKETWVKTISFELEDE